MTKTGRLIQSFGEFVRETVDPPVLDGVLVTNGSTFERLDEGKWARGRFEKSLRIDQPTHGVGMTHGHVFGRKGNQLGVVNIDGTGSHGTKMKLHPDDADALRQRGFEIRRDNIVEWTVLESQPQLLLG